LCFLPRHVVAPILVPYTTLFRSQLDADGAALEACLLLNIFKVRAQLFDLAATGDLWQRDDQIFRDRAPGGFEEVFQKGLECANRDRKSTRLNSSHVKISYAGIGL